MIAFKLELFPLNIMPEIVDKEMRYLIIHVITAARILYGKYMKQTEIPSLEELTEKILEMAEIDVLTEALNEMSSQKGFKNWERFYSWTQNMDWKA